MDYSDLQNKFTRAMQKKYPSLFPDKNDELYAVNRFGIEVFPGWFRIVENMIDDIADYSSEHGLTDSLKIAQIKTDFCLLRCNMTTHDDHVDEIVAKYKTLARQACEYCGEPGEIRLELRWRKVLCDTCNIMKI
ncbi:hypothetical protein HF285_01030 [Acidithiobacillus ferrooxidans F221]|uniref:hypothetical protein n=1 Tax=Acidithiobacillus ferrooxidans TaxID=920 RepID=UPI001C07DBFE|nr:hypothetical protein [Acidithiobacillus ferrooxidans]MBU2806902.1 hypothetical protein [Acidithiobacillus ferrooxidans F221]